MATYAIEAATGYATLKVDGSISKTFPLDKYGVELINKGATKTVTAATNANPVVFTVANHGYKTGDSIELGTFAGGTWATVDNIRYTITVLTANTFSVNSLDSTSLGTFSSGTVFSVNDAQIQILGEGIYNSTIIVAKQITTPAWTSLDGLMDAVQAALSTPVAP